jgi:hypothetical protein
MEHIRKLTTPKERTTLVGVYLEAIFILLMCIYSILLMDHIEPVFWPFVKLLLTLIILVISILHILFCCVVLRNVSETEACLTCGNQMTWGGSRPEEKIRVGHENDDGLKHT